MYQHPLTVISDASKGNLIDPSWRIFYGPANQAPGGGVGRTRCPRKCLGRKPSRKTAVSSELVLHRPRADTFRCRACATVSFDSLAEWVWAIEQPAAKAPSTQAPAADRASNPSHVPDDAVRLSDASPGPPRPVDRGSFPHIIELIVHNLRGEDLHAARNVSRDWRHGANPRLLRHLRINAADRTHPLHFFSPRGRRVPLLLTGDQAVTLPMIQKHCRVVDCADTLDTRRSVAANLHLPNLEVLRRHGRSDGRFRFRTRTLVDFCASTLFAETQRTHVHCDRYVVPNVAYGRAEWREAKISKLGRVDYQSLAAVSFADLLGATSRCVREVVLLFLEGEVAELDDAFLLVKDGCSRMMLSRLPVPTITFVGLRPNDRRGDTLVDQLEEYIPASWRGFGVGTGSFRFLSHDEYRALVGEEQYGLETDRRATLLYVVLTRSSV